ncbi:MAG: HAD-IIB family hydrolase [Candidatus Sabulitectum sp.]|nr:HAD-IIB family hydrolase [Candidatus Sabulitectum sp.]
MKKTSLFATDLDGTLLRNDGTFSARDISALESLREKGCAVVLATGRSPVSLQKCLGKMELPMNWYVLSSGAGILDSAGNVTMSRILSSDDTAVIHRAFAEQGITDTSIQGTFPDAHILYWMDGKHCLDFKKRLACFRAFSNKITDPGIPSTEVMGFVQPDQADYALSALQETIGDKFSIIRVTSPIDHETVWIEVFAKGVSKASACEMIRKELDIPLEFTAAVGNDWNDIQMLRWAKQSYISSNAPEPLLCEFENVPSNQNNAVATAIERWVL